jgi:hypothetical protein
MSRDDGAPAAGAGTEPGGGEAPAPPTLSSMGMGLARVRRRGERDWGTFWADWSYGCMVWFGFAGGDVQESEGRRGKQRREERPGER